MITSPRAHWWINTIMALTIVLFAVAYWLMGRPMQAEARADEDEGFIRVACSQELIPDPHRRVFPMPPQNHLILSLWEPLVECDPFTGQPSPAAAEEWVWSPDRLVLTVRLRPDVRWSNGDAVTAEDYIRGWQRLLQQRSDLAQVLFPLRNAEKYHSGKLSDPAAVGMRALDKRTLQLELEKVRSTFVMELADPMLVPFHHSTEPLLADQAYLRQPQALVTNGPFRLDSIRPVGPRLRANERYHGRQGVRLAGIQFIRAADHSSAPLLIAAGRADLLSPMRPSEERAWPSARRVHLESELISAVSALELNTKRHPLDNQRVRQALALAMNRTSFIPKAEAGHIEPAYAWVPTMPGRPGLTLLREDAAEARRLLAEAGYPQGKGLPVLLMVLPASLRDEPHPKLICERWFQELGVRVRIVHENRAGLERCMQTGEYDLAYQTLVATVPDAADLLDYFTWPETHTRTGMVDSNIIGMLQEAGRQSGTRRLAMLEEAERRIMAELPVLPLMFFRREVMVAEEVRGWYADPLARQSFKRLWLTPGPARGDRS